MLLWLRCGISISFNDEYLFAGAEGGGLNCFLYLWYQVDISERFSGQWGFVVKLISKVEQAT